MLFDRRLSISELRVYAALLSIAGGSNGCTVSKKKISELSAVVKVNRSTKILGRCGYIGINQECPGGLNNYKLNLIDAVDRLTPGSTLSAFMKEYLSFSAGFHSIATTRTYHSCLRELLSFTGNISLKEINVRKFEQFLSFKKSNVSAYTGRRHYISLKSVFERARIWGLIESNPLKEIKMPKVNEVEVPIFSVADLEKLLIVVQDVVFRELILCFFYGCFRRSELLLLRWKDVDFEERVIYLRNSEIFTTKNGRNRIITMSQGLYSILVQRKERALNDQQFVFGDSKGRSLNPNTVSKKFRQYVLQANLNPRLHLHSIRHSGASLLLSLGAPSAAVQRLLGHKKLSTTEGYIHFDNSVLHETTNKYPLITYNLNK